MTMMTTRVHRRRRRQQQQSIMLLGILSLPSCSGFAGWGGPQLQRQTIASTLTSSLPMSTIEGETPPLGVRRSGPVLQMDTMSLGNSEMVASAQAAELQDILHEAMDLASSWEGYSTSQLSGLSKGILKQLDYMVENYPTEDSEPQEQVLHSQRVEKLEGHLEDFFEVIRARERGPTPELVAAKRTGFIPANPPKQSGDGKSSSSSSKVLHFLYKKQTPQYEEQLAPMLGSDEEDMLTPAMETVNEEVPSTHLLESCVEEDVSIISLESSSVSEDELATPLMELDIEEMSTTPLLETAAEKEELGTSLLESEEMELLETGETFDLKPSKDVLEATEVGAQLKMEDRDLEEKGNPVEAEQSTALVVGPVPALMEGSTQDESVAVASLEKQVVKEDLPLPFFATLVTQNEVEEDDAALPPAAVKEIEGTSSLVDRLGPVMAARPLFGKLRSRETEPDLDWRSIMERLEDGFRRKNAPKKTTTVIAPVKAETLVVPSSNKKEVVQQEEEAPPPPQEDLSSAPEPLWGEAHWTTKQDWDIPIELQEIPRLADRQLAQSPTTTTTTSDGEMTVVVDDDVEMPFYDTVPLLGKSTPEEVEKEPVSKKGTSLWGGKNPVSLFGVQRKGGGASARGRGGPLFGVRRVAASPETALLRPKFGAIDKAIGMLLVIKILNPAAAAAAVFGISKTNVLLVYVVTMLNFFYFKEKFDMATYREQRFTYACLWLSRFAFAFLGFR